MALLDKPPSHLVPVTRLDNYRASPAAQRALSDANARRAGGAR